MKKIINAVFSIILMATAIIPSLACSLFSINFTPECIQGTWWAFLWFIPMILAGIPWIVFWVFFVRWIKEEL